MMGKMLDLAAGIIIRAGFTTLGQFAGERNFDAVTGNAVGGFGLFAVVYLAPDLLKLALIHTA